MSEVRELLKMGLRGAILGACMLGVAVALASAPNSPPTCPPATAGCNTPINTSNSIQTKAGGGLYFNAITDANNQGIRLNANGSNVLFELGAAGNTFTLDRFNGSTWINDISDTNGTIYTLPLVATAGTGGQGITGTGGSGTNATGVYGIAGSGSNAWGGVFVGNGVSGHDNGIYAQGTTYGVYSAGPLLSGSATISGNATITGSATVGGSAVCTANGANCPSASGSTVTIGNQQFTNVTAGNFLCNNSFGTGFIQMGLSKNPNDATINGMFCYQLRQNNVPIGGF
jgi:hypothetical protein